MLNIRINGSPIDLQNEQGFEIISSNPVVDKDRISRAFSFPFTIPATPRNLSIRNHTHRLDALKKRKHVAGVVEFGGHQLLNGEVFTTKTSNDGEEAYIQNTPLDVWEQLKGFKITELLGTINVDTAFTQARWWLVLEAPPNLYQIYIDGTAIIYDSLPGDDTFDCVNALVALINAEWPGMATAQATATILLDSLMMNTYALDMSLTYHMALTDVVTEGERCMNNMLGHIEDVYATPVETHCFPAVKWFDLYPNGENGIFSNWVNLCLNGDAFANIKETTKRWSNSYIPMVRVPYVLDKIRERIGATSWIGPVFESEAIQHLIIVSNYCLDKVYYDRWDDGNFYYINGFETSWSLNACIPDITAADFILQICYVFNLTLEYGDGTLSFSKSKIKTDQPPVSLDGKVSRNYNIQKNSSNGWILKYQDSLLEKHTESGQLEPLQVGDGDIKIEIARTLYMSSDYTSALGYLKAPVTQQPGASRVFSSSAVRMTMPLTFLFERSIQAGELGTEYIYATHDTSDYAGVEIADYALSIDGEKGLVAVWHSGIVEYTDADMLSISALLGLGDIQKLMQWKAARATFYHPNGVVTGIIRNIKTKITGDVIAPVVIEILTKRSE